MEYYSNSIKIIYEEISDINFYVFLLEFFIQYKMSIFYKKKVFILIFQSYLYRGN